MLAELKREVGRLVVDTTAKVTGKVLTADDQKPPLRRSRARTRRLIAAMKLDKDARKLSKQLFRASFTEWPAR